MPTNLASPSILPPVSVLTFPCTMRARLAQATVRVLPLGNAATPAIERLSRVNYICRLASITPLTTTVW